MDGWRSTGGAGAVPSSALLRTARLDKEQSGQRRYRGCFRHQPVCSGRVTAGGARCWYATRVKCDGRASCRHVSGRGQVWTLGGTVLPTCSAAMALHGHRGCRFKLVAGTASAAFQRCSSLGQELTVTTARSWPGPGAGDRQLTGRPPRTFRSRARRSEPGVPAVDRSGPSRQRIRCPKADVEKRLPSSDVTGWPIRSAEPRLMVGSGAGRCHGCKG